jgi:nucleotide-binding universal stress UspA family protein
MSAYAEHMTQHIRHSPVLVVLHEGRAAFMTLARGLELARKLGVDLVVTTAVSPGENDGERATAALAGSVYRLDLLVVSTGLDLRVRVGAFRDVAIAIGRELQPTVVVISPPEDEAAELAIAIADALCVPVMIARDPQPDGSVVVATDMRDLRYPVIDRCRPLVRVLERPATYVHASPPYAPPIAPVAVDADAQANNLADIAADSKLARLERLARTEPQAEAIVMRSTRTVEAILDVAKRRDADLVVIGHRRRSHARTDRVCERVVAQCRRSVLVVPCAPVESPS